MSDSPFWQRSEGGTLFEPLYDARQDAAIRNGWRRATPPIVESLEETYEEVIGKQWDGKYDRW